MMAKTHELSFFLFHVFMINGMKTRCENMLCCNSQQLCGMSAFEQLRKNTPNK